MTNWHGYEDWNTYAVRDAHNHCLAVIGDVDRATSKYNQANARLMAAAPELLAALEDTLRVLVTPAGLPDKGKGRTQEQQAAFDAAMRAIAKAKGQ